MRACRIQQNRIELDFLRRMRMNNAPRVKVAVHNIEALRATSDTRYIQTNLWAGENSLLIGTSGFLRSLCGFSEDEWMYRAFTQFAKFRTGERGAVVSPDGVEPGLPMRVVDRTV